MKRKSRLKSGLKGFSERCHRGSMLFFNLGNFSATSENKMLLVEIAGLKNIATHTDIELIVSINYGVCKSESSEIHRRLWLPYSCSALLFSVEGEVGIG